MTLTFLTNLRLRCYHIYFEPETYDSKSTGQNGKVDIANWAIGAQSELETLTGKLKTKLSFKQACVSD